MEKIFKETGITLDVESDSMDKIADYALESGTGARAVKAIAHRLFQTYLGNKKIQSLKDKTIKISVKDIKEAQNLVDQQIKENLERFKKSEKNKKKL